MQACRRLIWRSLRHIQQAPVFRQALKLFFITLNLLNTTLISVAVFREDYNTTLLIQGIKGKINEQGQITDNETQQDLLKFINAYVTLIKNRKADQRRFML